MCIDCREGCTVHEATDCMILTKSTMTELEYHQIQTCVKNVKEGHQLCRKVKKLWGSNCCKPSDFKETRYHRHRDLRVFYFGSPRTLLEGYLDHARSKIDELHGSKSETDQLKLAWGRTLSGPGRVSEYCSKLSGLVDIPGGACGWVESLTTEVNAALKSKNSCGLPSPIVSHMLRGLPLRLLEGVLGPRSRHWRETRPDRDNGASSGDLKPLENGDRALLKKFDNDVRLPLVEAAKKIVEETEVALQDFAFGEIRRAKPSLFRILIVDDFYPLLFPWCNRMAALEPWEFEFHFGLPRPENELDLPRKERVQTEKLEERLGLNAADPKPWHLVLLDIDFGWQGYGNVALDYLVALHKLLPKTPILMMSRWAYLDAAAPYLLEGATGYLCKYPQAYIDAEAAKYARRGRYEPDRFGPEHWRQVIKRTLKEEWNVREDWILGGPDKTGAPTVGRAILVDDTERPNVGYFPGWRPHPDQPFVDWCAHGDPEKNLPGTPPELRDIGDTDDFIARVGGLSKEADIEATSAVCKAFASQLKKTPELQEAEANMIAFSAIPLLRGTDPERYLLLPLTKLESKDTRMVALVRTPRDADDEAYYCTKLPERLRATTAWADRFGGKENRTHQLFMSLWKDLHYLVVSDFAKLSLFDILGPDMTGPSSSHTAGACRIGRLARNWLSALREGGVELEETTLNVVLHGSFRTTGEGHGSDNAILGGLLDYQPSNSQLKTARTQFGGMQKQREAGKNSEEGTWPTSGQDFPQQNFPQNVRLVWDRPGSPELHANTIRFQLVRKDADGKDKVGEWLTCRSWGGGNVQISGIGWGEEGCQLSESKLDRNKERFSGVQPIYIDGSWTMTKEEPSETKFIIERTIDPPSTSTGTKLPPALVTTLRGLAPRHAPAAGETSITVETPLSCSFVPEDSGRSKILAVVLDFRWESTSDGSSEGEGTSLSTTASSENSSASPVTSVPTEDKDTDSIWQQALDYECGRRQSGGRPKDDIRHGKPQPAKEKSGNEQSAEGKTGNEQPLTVRHVLEVMLASVVDGLRKPKDASADRKDAWRVFKDAKTTGVDRTDYAYAYSLAVQERNADHEQIIAAPTGGACGIVPGALFAVALDTEAICALVKEEKASGTNYLEKVASDPNQITQLEKALLTAAMIGLIINNVVPTAGAQYGCQAETGVGAAMAAAAVCQYLRGSPEAVIHAAALALKNSIGLTCDPVAGRVEVPCIKRSGMKAVEALVAGRAAFNGMRSSIPPEEVVWVLREAGEAMPSKFKETSLGGLAQTLTGRTGCATCGGRHCPGHT